MRSKERQSQQCHGTSTAKRKAQGGVFCGRKARIKLSMAEPQGTGQYGDAASPRPFGVETTSMAMHGSEERLVHWIVESTRHVWEFVSRQDSAPVFAKQATPAEPWTRVNNCTDNPEDENHGGTFEQVSRQKVAPHSIQKQTFTRPKWGIATAPVTPVQLPLEKCQLTTGLMPRIPDCYLPPSNLSKEWPPRSRFNRN